MKIEPKTGKYFFIHSKPPPKTLPTIVEDVVRCDQVPPKRMWLRVPTFRELAVKSEAEKIRAADTLVSMKHDKV